MAARDVVGRWQLVSWVVALPDGSSTRPLGESPHGQITYGADGRMTVFLVAEGRGEIQFQRGTVDERAAAYDSFAAYCGTYEVDDGEEQITHSVEFSSIPALTGNKVLRTFALDGDILRIGHSFGGPNGESKGTLLFRRA
jgi:hypothetical protein